MGRKDNGDEFRGVRCDFDGGDRDNSYKLNRILSKWSMVSYHHVLLYKFEQIAIKKLL